MIFLLSEFREKRAFPYIVNLVKQDDDVVCSVIGDDYSEYLARILASVYNGDDEVLFEIVENNNLDEFIRSSVLQTFSILYLYEEKSRDFLINYFKKLLVKKEPNDDNYLYKEILAEIGDLRLIELKEIISKVFGKNECTEEIEYVKNAFANENFEINKYVYPYSPCYEYINDT